MVLFSNDHLIEFRSTNICPAHSNNVEEASQGIIGKVACNILCRSSNYVTDTLCNTNFIGA